MGYDIRFSIIRLVRTIGACQILSPQFAPFCFFGTMGNEAREIEDFLQLLRRQFLDCVLNGSVEFQWSFSEEFSEF